MEASRRHCARSRLLLVGDTCYITTATKQVVHQNIWGGDGKLLSGQKKRQADGQTYIKKVAGGTHIQLRWAKDTLVNRRDAARLFRERQGSGSTGQRLIGALVQPYVGDAAQPAEAHIAPLPALGEQRVVQPHA